MTPDDQKGTRTEEREEGTPATGETAPDAGRSDSGAAAGIIGVLVALVGILLTVIGTGLAGGSLHASQRQAAALERIAEAVAPCIPAPTSETSP